MALAFLGLGSNLGDRVANLRRACDLVQNAGITVSAKSGIYETQSVDSGGEGDFLNAVLRIDTDLSPRQLLSCIRSIESTIGRPSPPRTGPRLIDIDILLFESVQMNSDGLEIPHPRMLSRAFVLRPLSDVLEGGWVAPASETW